MYTSYMLFELEDSGISGERQKSLEGRQGDDETDSPLFFARSLAQEATSLQLLENYEAQALTDVRDVSLQDKIRTLFEMKRKDLTQSAVLQEVQRITDPSILITFQQQYIAQFEARVTHEHIRAEFRTWITQVCAQSVETIRRRSQVQRAEAFDQVFNIALRRIQSIDELEAYRHEASCILQEAGYSEEDCRKMVEREFQRKIRELASPTQIQQVTPAIRRSDQTEQPSSRATRDVGRGELLYRLKKLRMRFHRSS